MGGHRAGTFGLSCNARAVVSWGPVGCGCDTGRCMRRLSGVRTVAGADTSVQVGRSGRVDGGAGYPRPPPLTIGRPKQNICKTNVTCGPPGRPSVGVQRPTAVGWPRGTSTGLGLQPCCSILRALGSIPRAVWSIPAALGSIPRAVWSIPTALGSIPRAALSILAALGSIFRAEGV